MKHLVLLPFILCSLTTTAQDRILIDGEFSDWSNISSAYDDATGDEGASGIDFEKAKVYNDADYVFFYIETGVELNLQDFNNVQIHLDVDNNSSTGTSRNSMGVDLTYAFGSRSGTYYTSNGSEISIKHIDVSLITAPTITSDRFEIAIQRSFIVNGNTVTMGDSVRFSFNDNITNGDNLPANNGAVGYAFSSKNVALLPSYSIQKPASSDLRIMSYNVERDGFFETNRVPAYTRIFQAVQPDIIGFQEIYNHSSKEVADQLESILPAGTGQVWHHAMAAPDCHAVSRYPITKSAQIPGSGGSGNGAFLINIPNSDVDMLFIVAHPPCCSNNEGRQIEVDQIMKFVREAKLGKGAIPIEQNAPILIVGDMNFVGDHKQLTTLLTGNISDESTYGPDFTPDWDSSSFIDSKPYTTGVPFAFTWYSESSAFSPGKLDYIIYSGSNMVLNNGYCLFTPGLAPDSLTAYQLLTNDAIIASDHLPVVADFTLKTNSTTGVIVPIDDKSVLKIYPNPSNAEIRFEGMENESQIRCTMYDATGKIVFDLKDISANSTINISKLSSGLYFVKTTGVVESYFGKFRKE